MLKRAREASACAPILRRDGERTVVDVPDEHPQGMGIRELTNPTAELSAVARWCLLLRNDKQLARLVG